MNHEKNIITKTTEEASIILENGAKEAVHFTKYLEKGGTIKKSKRFWNILGPGLITGAADDDPSGIATYSQTGASTGFTFLWLAAFTFPLMAFVQEMCARIALVTGKGLASNIRIHFGKKLLYICVGLLVVANTVNIGADLAAMAEAMNLIAPFVPATFFLIAIGFACILLEVFVSYKKYSSYLKWLTFVLISYILVALVVNFRASDLLYYAFVPSFVFDKSSIFLITAILGTTISPYLFFWQTSQEVEEGIEHGELTLRSRIKIGPRKISGMRVDVWIGMFFSNLVMFFIIAVCAETLFKAGITNIETAGQAAAALRPLAGDGAYLLFALGIIGTGFLAVPVLAGSSAYALAETFSWREGLYRKLRSARSFYGVIVLSILAGVLLQFLGISPIKALIYSAILNGLIAPIVIILVVLIASNKKIMGTHTNARLSTFIGWFSVILMIIVALTTIFSLVSSQLSKLF